MPACGDHALEGGKAFGRSVVDVGFDQVAGIIHIIGDHGACAKEEGGLVPAGVDLHVELLASRVRLVEHAFQGGRISDDGLVIVQEVSVIARHGVSIHQAAQGDSRDGAAVVFLRDDGRVFFGQLNQSAGSHQAGQLVLGKTEDVGAAFDVGDHIGSSVAFADRLNKHGHPGIFGVRGLELLDLGLGQVNHRVGDPNLHFARETFSGRCETCQ